MKKNLSLAGSTLIFFVSLTIGACASLDTNAYLDARNPQSSNLTSDKDDKILNWLHPLLDENYKSEQTQSCKIRFKQNSKQREVIFELTEEKISDIIFSSQLKPGNNCNIIERAPKSILACKFVAISNVEDGIGGRTSKIVIVKDDSSQKLIGVHVLRTGGSNYSFDCGVGPNILSVL